jgi:hypothetical protein
MGLEFFSRILKLRDIREISRGNGRKKASIQGVALGFMRGDRALGGFEERD